MSTPGDRYTVDPGAGVLLSDLGLSAGNVLRRAGLPADLFSRAPVSLPTGRYFALWEALEAEAGDPVLPIRIGEAISVEVFAPPIFAALCSPNLAVAAARIARYKPLIGPLRLIVTPDERGMTVEMRWPAPLDPPAALTASELVFWVALARLGTRAHVRPLAVTSPHPPGAPEAFTGYLGVPVGYGRAYSVTFSARDAARPFLTANEPMWRFFEPELGRRLSQLRVGASATDRVRAALHELLPSGRGSVDGVARELAVSGRTLQRQLREEGTSFQAVLSGTRESLARHYLADGRLTAAQIAFLLGYEDPSSFYRAFQSWTGQTPQRARLAAATDLARVSGRAARPPVPA